LILLSVMLSGCRPEDKKPPNVLFIIVDDLRPEINAWGQEYIKTPNIDKLSDKGISFTRAFCQYANCRPSRKSFLSGLSPETTGHQSNFNPYDLVMDHTSMPEFFRGNGYYTASMGKIYHAARDDRDSWDFYFDVGDPENPEQVPWECYGLPANQAIEVDSDRPATEGEDLPMDNYNDYIICRTALDQLEEYRDKSFFLAVGFRKPHLPFAAPKNYWDLYNREDIEVAGFPDAPENGDTIVYMWSELSSYKYYATQYKTRNYRNKQVSTARSKELRHGYFACVSYIDDLVGMLTDKLKELGIEEETIIVLTGDHGYNLGDQQIWGKHSCYDLSTNVPLIVYDPSVKRDTGYCVKFVELLDLYPTLAELCGLPEPERFDGKSFAELFEDASADGFDAAFNQYQSFQEDPWVKNLMAYTIHTEEYNYIEWQDLADNRRVVQRELYRVHDVRIEQENIASEPDYESLIEELSAQIKVHFGPYRESFNKFQILQDHDKSK